MVIKLHWTDEIEHAHPAKKIPNDNYFVRFPSSNNYILIGLWKSGNNNNNYK